MKNDASRDQLLGVRTPAQGNDLQTNQFGNVYDGVVKLRCNRSILRDTKCDTLDTPFQAHRHDLQFERETKHTHEAEEIKTRMTSPMLTNEHKPQA